jgi:hypothetical protein
MTKILINEEGRPMHNPNGWPERPGPFEYHDSTGEALDAAFDYRKALEKAKAEAIPIDVQDPLTDASLALAYHKHGIGCQSKNTFIEIDAEVEVVEVYEPTYTPKTKDELQIAEWESKHELPQRRKKIKVARIKKQESQYNYTDGGYVPPDTIVPVNQHVAIGWDQAPPPEQLRTCEPLTFGEEMEQIRRYGQDMQRENAELKAKLEKAEGNLKSWELLWGPVIDYCQNSSNARRLGIKPGDSISKRILEIIQEK